MKAKLLFLRAPLLVSGKSGVPTLGPFQVPDLSGLLRHG
jgi:hypothetical protein